MSILEDISENLQKGKAKIVKELVQQAIDEGISPDKILGDGLLAGMSVIGEKFKNNEVYIPEVLVAARSMNMGAQVLKPYLEKAGIKAAGRVCIGTVQGDLHDIGKNLVASMLEGRGFKVVNLGTDVSKERFIEAAKEHHADIIAMSALLTTTMDYMKEVVDAVRADGIQVKVMIGGAPVTAEFASSIGADGFSTNANEAVEVAKRLLS